MREKRGASRAGRGVGGRDGPRRPPVDAPPEGPRLVAARKRLKPMLLIAKTDPPMATQYECPSCGASVDADAKECPKCGEIFDATALQTDSEAAAPREAARRERSPS